MAQIIEMARIEVRLSQTSHESSAQTAPRRPSAPPRNRTSEATAKLAQKNTQANIIGREFDGFLSA
jgi:hypothetical protein